MTHFHGGDCIAAPEFKELSQAFLLLVTQMYKYMHSLVFTPLYTIAQAMKLLLGPNQHAVFGIGSSK